MNYIYIFKIIFCLIVVIPSNAAPKKMHVFGVAAPSYTIHGIDVSRYQDKIDWKHLSNYKAGKDSVRITFAFVKATEGQTLKDRYFEHNWQETTKYNIIRGAYHYYKPNTNSALQAKNFIRHVKLKKGDLPPVLDIEEVGKYGVKNMKKGIKNWLTMIEAHYGIKPIIYTNISFYKSYLSGSDFKEYRFWIAHYSHITPKIHKDWIFWQYSDKGVIKNIRSKVALNVHSGTKKDLLYLCKK